MYTQVYFHCVSRIYEVHLKDFLAEWLKREGEDGKFPTAPDQHLAITDHEVTAAIWKAARDTGLPGHEPARRIVERDHYRLIYQRNPEDTLVNPFAAEDVFLAASKKFGDQRVRRDSFPAKDAAVDFPILKKDGDVASSPCRIIFFFCSSFSR